MKTNKMMKTSFFKIALPLMAGALLLTSCDDEPAVGTPLNTVAEENYGPKVYLYQGGRDVNTARATVVQTPFDVVMPEDTFDVYVRLTSPVAEDVSVSLVPDDSLSAAYGDGTAALPSSALEVVDPTVVIKAGQRQSDQPVRVTLKASDAFKTLQGTGVAALKLSTTSKAVAVAQEYNHFDVLVNVIATNLKSQSREDLDKLTEIGVGSYKVSVDGQETTDLTDGSTDTYSYYYAPYEIVMQMDETKSIAGLSFQYGYDQGYMPSVVEIQTSDDGENWTSQTNGEVSNNYYASSVADPIPWVFYSAVKCKYVKLRLLNCFYGERYGSDYNAPIVSEIRLYE